MPAGSGYILGRKFIFYFLSLNYTSDVKFRVETINSPITCEPSCVSFFFIFSSVKRFETS